MGARAHLDTSQAERKLRALLDMAARVRAAGRGGAAGRALDPAKVAQAAKRYGRRNGFDA